MSTALGKVQYLLLEQWPNVEFLRIPEIGKAEEEAVGDEVAGEVAFQNGRLVICAVIGLADAVGGVVSGRSVAQRQRDLAGFGCGVFVDVEQVLQISGIKILCDAVLGAFPRALQEGIQRPVEARTYRRRWARTPAGDGLRDSVKNRGTP